MISFQKNYIKELILVNNKFSELVQSFLTSYLRNECNFSTNTIASYSQTIYLFVIFMAEEKSIKANKIEIELITRETIIQFLNWLETKRNNSISTRNQRLSCIKSFFKYVQLNEISMFDNCSKILSIKFKKASNKIITYFSEKEIKIMLDYLNKNDFKLLTMVCVLYETGTRVSEFINIKLDDLHFDEKSSYIQIYGKGRKLRQVPISDELVNLIKIYLKNYYIDFNNNYLFNSNQKKKYTRYGINYLLKKLAEKLRELYPGYFTLNFHPHIFRHTKASHLYNNGVPLTYIRDLLGHTVLASTEIYSTPDKDKQRKEIQKNSKAIGANNRYSKSKKETLEKWLKTQF